MEHIDFCTVVLSLQKMSRVKSDLYRLGVDLIEYDELYIKSINVLIKSIYGEEGLDWFEWFCWESDFGQKDWSKAPGYRTNEDGSTEKIYEAGEVRFGATDENGDPICYSVESTWEYLEKNHRVDK